ncbi:hypothetical protein HY488_00740 [Candidatus Woesearchaeota archaeon]|nr:hypothetical protein [Candidatus Woesearchaeota archaeon]
MGKKRAMTTKGSSKVISRKRSLTLPPPAEHKRQAEFPLHVQMPHLGLKLLYWYTMVLGVLYVFYFFAGLYNPSLFLLKSYASLIIDVVLIVLLFYIFYGFKNRRYWAWKLSMLWYTFAVIYSILLVYVLRQGLYTISRELFMISSFFLIVINGLIVWYIYQKRDYFLDKMHREVFGIKDKFFVYSIVCFWAMLLTIGITVGIKFYQDTTQLADSLINELSDIAMKGDWQEGNLRCAAKSGAGKDVCYVVLATISHGKADYCGNIESHVYRFSCRHAVLSERA